ncbi:hypothetical protein PAXINDRAFT_177435 [Paxillus involutus ATCC 200175]|uniref:Uncharacterized protein n=1 Tax=Paxillus involutus ATCC 200175 TaxID=664439 RepID=A0A0C9TSC3_PAXIN|nr:hypothetical protein PAXINDRAFT_177435 [Paxillus involutus ATCC 200175]
MGAEDLHRQALNVFRIKMLGRNCKNIICFSDESFVIPVESGSKTLKDAVNEAMRDWAAKLANIHFLVGSYIGREIKAQLKVATGKLSHVVVACFYDFISDKSVRLVGPEAGGEGMRGALISDFLHP